LDFNESLFPEFLNLIDPTYGTTTSGTPTELTMEKLDEAIRLATKDFSDPMIKQIIVHESDYQRATHLFRKIEVPDQYTTYWGIPFRISKGLPVGTGAIQYTDGTFKFFNIN
jgi:hypothetical protein